MIIHKGEKYTIELEGSKAVKRCGDYRREMTYFPERDAGSIAGEIDEKDAWQLLLDMANGVATCKTPVSPSHLLITPSGFLLSEWSESHDPAYTAPEGYSPVWAIGATLFFLFMGCKVFHGMGGAGQTVTTPVPTMRRELPELSGFIAGCLAFEPEKRPTLAQIKHIAEENLVRFQNDDRVALRRRLKHKQAPSSPDDVWPEDFE